MDFFDPPSALDPHPVPRFLSGLPMDRNVYHLARPRWGKDVAEWALTVALDIQTARPETEFGSLARIIAAGILCAAAVESGVEPETPPWDHVVADITTMTGVTRAAALLSWTELVASQ